MQSQLAESVLKPLRNYQKVRNASPLDIYPEQAYRLEKKYLQQAQTATQDLIELTTPDQASIMLKISAYKQILNYLSRIMRYGVLVDFYSQIQEQYELERAKLTPQTTGCVCNLLFMFRKSDHEQLVGSHKTHTYRFYN